MQAATTTTTPWHRVLPAKVRLLALECVCMQIARRRAGASRLLLQQSAVTRWSLHPLFDWHLLRGIGTFVQLHHFQVKGTRCIVTVDDQGDRLFVGSPDHCNLDVYSLRRGFAHMGEIVTSCAPFHCLVMCHDKEQSFVASHQDTPPNIVFAPATTPLQPGHTAAVDNQYATWPYLSRPFAMAWHSGRRCLYAAHGYNVVQVPTPGSATADQQPWTKPVCRVVRDPTGAIVALAVDEETDQLFVLSTLTVITRPSPTFKYQKHLHLNAISCHDPNAYATHRLLLDFGSHMDPYDMVFHKRLRVLLISCSATKRVWKVEPATGRLLSSICVSATSANVPRSLCVHQKTGHLFVIAAERNAHYAQLGCICDRDCTCVVFAESDL